jgi:hypothetical protein
MAGDEKTEGQKRAANDHSEMRDSMMKNWSSGPHGQDHMQCLAFVKRPLLTPSRCAKMRLRARNIGEHRRRLGYIGVAGYIKLTFDVSRQSL